MNFYNYLYISSFIINIQKAATNNNPHLKVTRSGLSLISPCSVGLVFFAEVNNTSEDKDFEVEIIPDECCLNSGDNVDCDSVEIVGDSVEIIPKGISKTMKLVAPILDPYERHGYCLMFLDSKLNTRQRSVMRDTVKIPFDTRIKKKRPLMNLPDNIKTCPKIDEDPFNDCKPVDCDTFYNGHKSFYNKKLKRCVDVPPCVAKKGDYPNIIYDPASNQCIDESFIKADIDFIKELNTDKGRLTKDILIMKNVNTSEENKVLNQLSVKESKLKEIKRKCLAKYLSTNKYTLIVLGLVILVQCCLIFTLVYCFTNSCQRCSKKKVVRQFFNYRQDASVTTPLIGTSNIDTETTEYQFVSESSNVDKKIKCYKACQKERNNNAKISMSDDILSKCLNRRNWDSKPTKSDVAPESSEQNNKPKQTVEERKTVETKVNFENETDKKEITKIKSIVKRKGERSGHENDDLLYCSEKEIKCHSYGYDYKSNVTGFKSSDPTNNYEVYKTDTPKRETISISSEKEKGAQASFSNDSIDDFLSERGITFLARDGVSKYSFTSESKSIPASLSSDVSSKTSKNNIIKNMLSSILHRKSKHGPSSDPGLKKTSDNLDVELLHISHASVFSSSNNDSDYLKGLKRQKDSRTSL